MDSKRYPVNRMKEVAMMRRIMIGFLLLVLCLVLASCQGADESSVPTVTTGNPDTTETKGAIKGEPIPYSVISEAIESDPLLSGKGERAAVIRSSEECIAIRGEFLRLYDYNSSMPSFDDTYFRDHTLLMLSLTANTEGERFFVESVYAENGVLTVTVKSHVREGAAIGNASCLLWVTLSDLPFKLTQNAISLVRLPCETLTQQDYLSRYPDESDVPYTAKIYRSTPRFDANTMVFKKFITSKNELEEYLETAFVPSPPASPEAYDEAFFSQNTLLLVSVLAPSGTNRYRVESVRSDGSTLTVSVGAYTLSGVTDDMACWTAFISLDASAQNTQGQSVRVFLQKETILDREEYDAMFGED